ncbi:uncharacterized protein L969DRAFT_52264 [Mixia osmundae IAM 14324]|uniref:C2 domain-containing protein n=1 Tax=Mixia osmundae (strain CBS 9802 / IAM 14324 / JCM 22182 / KY 12970) TaxID=764103 RepID=G7EA25_MIXOS|nr:uncharacterized protein L969DRAFT_52264 [Mixia osmundae IAM 14324]KEI37585.1 hypothetical protein L969DRAFT_52264 [Mixia osmundae IAM 14324]GAA99685.1 hypothetical protein E5Q_06388 [Mixia osmundae IAM 14324]
MTKRLGTLIVVVIRARHLPNKKKVGKQDPYCTVSHGADRKKTQVIKRGGQQPKWDDELRFEIWHDLEDELLHQRVAVTATSTGGVLPLSPPAQSGESSSTSSLSVGNVSRQASSSSKMSSSSAARASLKPGQKTLQVAVYADDPKDPEIVGEATFDLAETLKKGETDVWLELRHKDRYAGEVFLEMTFYSADPPPVNRSKKASTPLGPSTVDNHSRPSTTYGGAGHFEPPALGGAYYTPDPSRAPSLSHPVISTPSGSLPLPPEDLYAQQPTIDYTAVPNGTQLAPAPPPPRPSTSRNNLQASYAQQYALQTQHMPQTQQTLHQLEQSMANISLSSQYAQGPQPSAIFAPVRSTAYHDMRVQQPLPSEPHSYSALPAMQHSNSAPFSVAGYPQNMQSPLHGQSPGPSHGPYSASPASYSGRSHMPAPVAPSHHAEATSMSQSQASSRPLPDPSKTSIPTQNHAFGHSIPATLSPPPMQYVQSTQLQPPRPTPPIVPNTRRPVSPVPPPRPSASAAKPPMTLPAHLLPRSAHRISLDGGARPIDAHAGWQTGHPQFYAPAPAAHSFASSAGDIHLAQLQPPPQYASAEQRQSEHTPYSPAQSRPLPIPIAQNHYEPR